VTRLPIENFDGEAARLDPRTCPASSLSATITAFEIIESCDLRGVKVARVAAQRFDAAFFRRDQCRISPRAAGECYRVTPAINRALLLRTRSASRLRAEGGINPACLRLSIPRVNASRPRQQRRGRVCGRRKILRSWYGDRAISELRDPTRADISVNRNWLKGRLPACVPPRIASRRVALRRVLRRDFVRPSARCIRNGYSPLRLPLR